MQNRWMIYRFGNMGDVPLLLIMEPWAHEFTIPAGKKAEVRIETESGESDFWVSPTMTSLWSPEGARSMIILIDGEDCTPDHIRHEFERVREQIAIDEQRGSTLFARIRRSVTARFRGDEKHPARNPKNLLRFRGNEHTGPT